MMTRKSIVDALLAGLLAALVVSCGPDGGGAADAGPDFNPTEPQVCDPTLCTDGVIGELYIGEGLEDDETGLLSYRPIDDGDEVTIVPGFQGGQHVWLILRARNVETCFVTPHYVIDDGGTNPVLDAYFGGEFYTSPDDPDEHEFLSYAAFVADPERVHGRMVTLRAEVSDGCGHLMQAEVEVVPRDPRLESE